MGEKTFFVGNLSSGVTSAELERLFSASIPVGKVEVKQRQDSDVTFAFVTVNAKDDNHIRECIKKLNGVR
jgi:RNA recognition motif-containing protein